MHLTRSENSIEKCKSLLKDHLPTLCGQTLKKSIHGHMEVEVLVGFLDTRL